MKTTLWKFTVAWPLVIFLLVPTLTRAETAIQAWLQRYNGPGNGDDRPYAIAVDASNNIIVAGLSETSPGSYDFDLAAIKYSSTGVPLWTNRYNNGGASAVAVDSSNNVIVTGYSIPITGAQDYLTIKYSSGGMPLWTNRYNNGAASAVAVDGSNNVVVTGCSTGSGGASDYATIKYSSAGVALWTNRYYGGPAGRNDGAYAVAVDGGNNVIVTGYSYGSGISDDYATIKYSNAGVPLWTNCYAGPGNSYDYAKAVAVDGSNNVIVTGWSASTTVFPNNHDYATIEYSSAGVPLWTNCYNGPGNSGDYAYAMAVDGSNNVIVTGSSTGSGGSGDYATIKYSSAGVALWTNRYHGPGLGFDGANAVAVDRSGSVIVTGYSSASPGPYISDYTTIKYSIAGVPLWTNRYNGSANNDDQAYAMAVDHSGNVIVTGTSSGGGGDSDFATIKYICVPSPLMTGLQLTNGTFRMRVDDVLQPGTLVIEASTDLAGWAPVFTNTMPTNVLFYTDLDASNSPTRFYRTFQFP